jgi:hypothetical protein
MNLTWSRVLAIGVVAVIVLGLGALEVFIGRMAIDPLPPSPSPSAAGGEPSRDLLEPVQFGDLEGRATDDSPGAVQTGRLTGPGGR